jgi:hypothetical protein
MANNKEWGQIYQSSWFGKDDAENDWGIVYPTDSSEN